MPARVEEEEEEEEECELRKPQGYLVCCHGLKVPWTPVGISPHFQQVSVPTTHKRPVARVPIEANRRDELQETKVALPGAMKRGGPCSTVQLL